MLFEIKMTAIVMRIILEVAKKTTMCVFNTVTKKLYIYSLPNVEMEDADT